MFLGHALIAAGDRVVISISVASGGDTVRGDGAGINTAMARRICTVNTDAIISNAKTVRTFVERKGSV